MWNALRKKVNKSSHSYQLSSTHQQSDSDDDDSDSGGGVATKVVFKRYTKIPSCSGLADMTTTGDDPGDVAFTTRYENPYASLDSRTVAAPCKPLGSSTGTDSWATVDNARHLLPSNDTSPDATDLRNNNHADHDVTKHDDVITAGKNPDRNANHFGSATVEVGGRVSPPRLKRREKMTSVVARRHVTGDDFRSATSQCDDVTFTTDTSAQVTTQSKGHVVIPGSSSTSVTVDDDESGYSTLRDILGQVERAMLEQQQQQQLQQQHVQVLCVAEDHADSDLDTSGDCRDIDLEQAGRSKSTDDCHVPITPAMVPDQPSTHPCGLQTSDRCETYNQKQQQQAEQSDLVDVNRNCAEIMMETSDVVQSAGEMPGAVASTTDHVEGDYDVPRSTPVRGRQDHDDAMCHGVRRPTAPPPPPPNDDNTDDASSTPLDGTPRSQISSSTLTQQQCEPQTADESTSATDDNVIRVELSGDLLTVSEPTHMSWEEVLQSAHVLGIPLHPQRPPPAVVTSAAVRRSSTSSSVTSSDRSFVSSPMNSPGARCRTSAPPVVLPRHLVTRRAVSSSPSTKQPKHKKTSKGASPFRDKLHNLFARKGEQHHHQSKDRGRSNASPTDDRSRSCSDKTRQRGRRDDVDCSQRPAASRMSAEVSPSAADLINCGYRESMLSVLSSSFSSGSLGSIFSHASSTISSNSSSTAANRQHRHQYHHQPSSSSSSSSSAWRNSFAG